MDMQPTAKNNMQPASTDDMHNTFWREDQVCILFLSSEPLLNEAGRLNKEGLQSVIHNQPANISNFLRAQQGGVFAGKEIDVQLGFIGDQSQPGNMAPDMGEGAARMPASEDDTVIFPGVYPFEVAVPPLNLPFPVKSSIVSFFQIQNLPRQPGGMASMGMSTSGDNQSTDSLVVQIVKKINTFWEILNKQVGEGIAVAVAAPAWLTGGTQSASGVGQGCPLTPPMPVEHDSCSNWRFRLPNLSTDLRSMTGKGVTVFILDAFPEREVIRRARRDAGDDNVLLRKVDRTVRFDYSILSGVHAMSDMIATRNAFVGKDVYGQHYPILLPDHGLFIAGIVRDIAPKASIECVRVLNDLCVGDVNLILNALSNIYLRKKGAKSESLVGRPVVINMSLVIPTEAELESKGLRKVDVTGGLLKDIRAPLFQQIKALTDLGVVIAASAGNEGDEREMTGYRPDALYPAAFCNEPYGDDNIIPVGAVDSSGSVMSYSCYPGARGVATLGGAVPNVPPPPTSEPVIAASDLKRMVRGIYSSVEYPPLSAMEPAQYYAAPNDHAWAYWVGTSFATPIVSALAARILQANPGANVHQTVLNEAGVMVQWGNLDPSVAGHGSGQQQGNMLTAVQECVHWDRDEDEEDVDEEVEVDIEVTEITLIENELGA